jgi:hypothetical protein
VNHEATIPNPALKPLGILVGEWSTVGTHPLAPGTTFHGRASFEWLEGGAFLIMRSRIDEPGIPSASRGGVLRPSVDPHTVICTLPLHDLPMKNLGAQLMLGLAVASTAAAQSVPAELSALAAES